MIAKFPAPFKPREIQKEILSRIGQSIDSGYKKILLCAPTGIGKSLVGVAVAGHLERSFIVTATKHLQDQYAKDISSIMPVKGKQNFPCLKIMSAKKVEDPKLAMQSGLTCQKGQCLERRVRDGKEYVEVCKFKPAIADVAAGAHDPGACHYYLQKYRALTSPHSLWNYHAFFQIMKYNKKTFADYLDRKVSVFDEAHKIEDQILQFVGIEISHWQTDECGINPDRYALDDLDSVISMLDDIAGSYAEKIKSVKDRPSFRDNPDYELVTRLERQYDRAAQAKIDILQDKDNFIAGRPARHQDGSFDSLSVKPVDISKFTKEFFETEYQVFMSATVDKPGFCENMGMDPNEVDFIDVPQSPFPAEHRRVEMLNVRQLSYRSSEDDELAVVRVMDKILDEHSDLRGLILTSSIPRCYKIVMNLSRQNSRRVRICHSKNRDGRTQNEILAAHAADPIGVLLSSSLWEGVDLKDDLSRFQIIAKIPYPSYVEKRVQAKMKKFPLWYQSQTLIKLLQGFGRSVRSEDDWADTYVLDKAVNTILYRARGMVPMSYRDVLGMR